jgi:CBS domain-containing protein
MNVILNRLETLVVQDVMSMDAIEVRPDRPLRLAAASMIQRPVSGLPVVNESRQCVGMLTAFDFVRRFAAEEVEQPARSGGGRVSSAGGGDGELPHREDRKIDTVADQMSPAVQSVSRNASLLEAARLMCTEHIHRLPVLDSRGRVEGMVTSLDIVAAIVNASDELNHGPHFFRKRRRGVTT